MKKTKPYLFYADKKPFKVQLDIKCQINGYRVGDKSAPLYNSIPVKKGDVFRYVAGKGIMVNEKIIPRKARPLKEVVTMVSWVSKRLRVAVFSDRDRIWNRKTKKYTKKLGKLYWVACDLRSYHVGCGKDVVEAVKALILQCQATNLIAEEEKAEGKKVIRWYCLLDSKELKEMERQAKKTGFILDGVEVPPLPKAWQRSLDRLREKTAQKK